MFSTTRKRKTNYNETKKNDNKKSRKTGVVLSKDEYLIAAACVKLTKNLLAFGASNVLQDIRHNNGISIYADEHRKNFAYISRKERSEDIALPSKQYYMHPVNHEKLSGNAIYRKSTAAVMTHTGACDQHAYVLASLLVQFMPEGTPINLCSLDDTI